MAESYSIQAVLSAVDKNFSSTMKDAAGASDDLDNGVQKSNTSIMDIAKGVGVFKLLEVGMNAVTGSVGAAVSRFDTLNQYPKVLESLGASAEDSDRGIQILSDGIDGLPTKLDDVAATSQQMFLVFRDADKASESTIALNNALLASGSSGDKAARGTEAYLKMLRSGKVDMNTWMGLQDTMGIGLDKVAKEMLGAEASTTDLYKELQSGTISIDAFNNAIVGMSDELGELARTNTKGIGTSFSNMANATSKGVANIIKSLDNLVKNAGINADGIAGIFDVLKGKINDSFNLINKSIDSATPYIENLIKLVGKLTPMLPALTAGATGVGIAFISWKIVNSVNGWLGKMNSLVQVSRVSIDAYSTSIKAGSTSTVAFQTAQKATNATTKTSTTLYGVLTGQIKLAEVAQMSLAKTTMFLKSTTGLLTIGLTAVVASAAAVTWAYKNQTKESRELKNSTQKTAETLQESTKEQEQLVESSKKQTAETIKLKNEIYNLASQENKSLEQKELLSQKVEELNRQVEGLGQAYDEEKDSLNMSNEQAQKRIELQAKIQAGADAEEKLVELQKQKKTATEDLAKTEALLEEQRKNGVSFEKERKNAEEAKLQGIQNLNDVEHQIAGEETKRKDAEKAKLEEVILARNTMVEEGKIDYQSLNDAQKSAFDSMQSQYNSLVGASTNAFEQIKQNETVSIDKMIENLDKNAEATSNWATNIKELAKRGVGDGMIAELEKMGPEGAKQAEELVKQSDEKLQELKNTYQKSAEAATTSMSTIIGEGGPKIAEGLEKSFNDANPTVKRLSKDSGLAQLGKDITNKVTLDIENGTEAVEKSVETLIGPTKDLGEKFKTSGKNTGEGLNDGIISMIPELEKTSNQMADKVNTGFTGPMQIKSPSRVMIENGGFVVSGLIKGIEQNQNSVIRTMGQLSENVKQPLDNLPNQFENIGYNAMIGLNNGLVSARGSVINTANSIANDVANTMRKALDIHSPSRVMQAIGNFVGQGLAIGMEDSTKLVGRASESLAQASMISPSSFASDSIDGRGLTLNLDLTLQMLNKDFRSIVEGITEMQNANMRLESSF